jgi:hypothetical protein
MKILPAEKFSQAILFAQMDVLHSAWMFFYSVSSFSSTRKKTNQKKAPVSRFILRVADMAGARGNSPRLR